ncbi:MAG: sulfatase, partial [Planctomycetes bacterium]|nr:sulfatase [Planctomycetota bacterium]
LFFFVAAYFSTQENYARTPNFLIIIFYYINDWVGCLGGHPQSLTPNIDALAKRGVLFTNAHCNGPICNPSRVSFMTGVRPSTSGIYLNGHRFRSRNSRIRSAVTLPQHFAKHGYQTLGCGKLFHGSGGKENFQFYGPAGGQGPLPKKRLNCPLEQSRSRLWDWGVFPEEEGDSYNDIADAKWTAKRLGEPCEKPFLLACGFYRPHVPFFAPPRFFDKHPRNDVKLPPVLDTDRDDIPAFALKLTNNPLPPSHDWFEKSGQWQHAVQSYLACVSFTDDNVGKVVAALDAGPHADNTWIVLLSDHGFFLGEKQRWAKQALWERATKVPLIIVPPRKLAHQFAAVGNRCAKPVELLSIYPTLIEVCRLPGKPKQLEGHSLVPLLKDADANWPHFAITTHDGDNHAVRDDRYRYIRYADGSEELYDIDTDPNEWENLARDPKMKSVIARLAKAVPTNVADPPRVTSPSGRGDWI